MKKPLFFREHSYDVRLLPVRQLRAKERRGSPEQIRSRTGFSIGYPGWGLIYYLVLTQYRRGDHGLILETGTNQGATTAVLAQALLDAGVVDPRVVSFEIDKNKAAVAVKFLKKCGLEGVADVRVGNTRDTLVKTLNDEVESSPVRLAFLDASHLLNDVQAEFEAVLPFLDNDALVIFDNTYPIAEPDEPPRVAEFLDVLTQRYGGSFIELPFVSWFTPGVAIWQRSRPTWS